MLSFKQKIAAIPEGVGALFFIQMFATLGFAVLYSTLVLYTTKHLNFSVKESTAIFGVFGAFNYGLHLFGGYLAGRFLSNRNLFVGGMLAQVVGCAIIAGGSAEQLFWGLSFFLTGSGLNVTCLNLMLTQRFKPEDTRREAAFLWNYAGMNLGFFVGFSVAGYYQLDQNYTRLFIFATVGNFVSILLAIFNWKALKDLTTPLLSNTKRQFKWRFLVGLMVLFGLIPVVFWNLKNAALSSNLVIAAGIFILAVLVIVTLKHPDRRERNNMWAYLILALGSLVFWSLYQMAPSGLELFTDSNLNRIVWGIEIAPQWIQNLNAFVVMIGGPILATWFTRLRQRGWKIDIPQQFAAALILIGLGFLVLPLGIVFADKTGLVAFGWIVVSYVFQSLGELLISPIGYAMVGRLAPLKYQGVMMGAWMLVTGVASIMSSYFSSFIPEASAGNAAATNPVYSKIFGSLGWSSVAVGVLLVLLIPILRRLISDKAGDKANDKVTSEINADTEREIEAGMSHAHSNAG